MNRLRNRFRNPSLLWWLYCLTLAAFVCRALVPVGFMPDPTGLQDGRLALVLCPSQGPPLPDPGLQQVLFPHAAGASAGAQQPAGRHHADAPHADMRAGAHASPAESGDHEVHSKMACPFSLLAASALVTSGTSPFVLDVFFLHVLSPRVADRLPVLAAVGPPLGARAPPAFLV